MRQTKLVGTPPKGVMRLILRLPITLYRLRLGWLLGKRFVLLNHVGRKTGQLRQTVVEVVGYDAGAETYYIVSGWGAKSNWYQNLVTQPDITIQVGHHHLKSHARVLTTTDAVQVLLNYRQRHPVSARELSRIMGLNIADAAPPDLGKIISESLPVLALEPRAQ